MRKSNNEDYGEDFFSRFPHLYAAMWEEKPTCPLSERGGVECGPGWKHLIVALSEKLEAMIVSLPETERTKYRCEQIKQKFGGMRFYMSDATSDMHHLILGTQGLSLMTCERCGATLPRIVAACIGCTGRSS